MFEWMYKIQADFCREDHPCIIVSLTAAKLEFRLYYVNVECCSEVLTEKELAIVILILERKKEAMLKQRNFPYVYGKMLTELCDAQKERYGVKGNGIY